MIDSFKNEIFGWLLTLFWFCAVASCLLIINAHGERLEYFICLKEHLQTVIVLNILTFINYERRVAR